MPAVADYIIIKDAQFRVDGSGYSFAMPPVAVGTKSILMFRMYVRFITGINALWTQDLIVQINGNEILKLWVPHSQIGASTIHEVISENPAEIYKQRANTISFRAAATSGFPGGAPLPDIMVSDVVLWFQTQVG